MQECKQCQELKTVLLEMSTRIGFLRKAFNRRPPRGHGYEVRKLQELFQDVLDGKLGATAAETAKSGLLATHRMGTQT